MQPEIAIIVPWVVLAIVASLLTGREAWIVGVFFLAAVIDLTPGVTGLTKTTLMFLVFGAPLGAWCLARVGQATPSLAGLASVLALSAMLSSGYAYQLIGAAKNMLTPAQSLAFASATITAVCVVVSAAASVILLVPALVELPLRWLNSALIQAEVVPWTALRTLAIVFVLALSINVLIGFFVAELNPIQLMRAG